MKESKVEKLVTDWFNAQKPHIWYMKTQGNLYSKDGAPDYTGTYYGRGFGVETKAGNGHPLSMVQLHEGLKLAHAGAIFVVAFADFKGLDDALRNAEHIDIPERILTAKSLVMLSSDDYALLKTLHKSLNSKPVTRSFV